jgi:hypothetical protein
VSGLLLCCSWACAIVWLGAIFTLLQIWPANAGSVYTCSLRLRVGLRTISTACASLQTV